MNTQPRFLPRLPRGSALCAPAGVFLLIFFVIPLAHVIGMSLTEPKFGLANYLDLFASTYFIRILLFTFETAAIVTLGALILSYPLAYVAATTPYAAVSTFLLTVVALSFWTSFLVRTYAWMVILGIKGPVSSLLHFAGWEPAPKILFTTFSANVGMIHALVPIMVMSIYAVMKQIDPHLTRAAASLGAGPIRAFITVYFPQSLPGVMAGCTLVFITCLGFYAMPVLLGSPVDKTIAGAIGDQIENLTQFGVASAMSIVLLMVTLVLFVTYNHFFGIDRLWKSD